MSSIIAQSSEWFGRHRGAMLGVSFAAVFAFGVAVHAYWFDGRHGREQVVEAPHDEHAGHVHPPDAEVTDLRALTVSPAVRALMNVEVAPVERRYVTAVVRMVGKVDFDETRLRYITAWTRGRLDRLFVDFTGIEVRKGDHVASLYSEDLIVAQEELIQALRFDRDRPAPSARQPGARSATVEIDLAKSARDKLRRLGMTDEQIRETERLERAPTHVTIHSPVSGTVIEKLRQEGDRVEIGDRIFAVADLKHLWVRMDAYESDLPWIRYGQPVEFTTEAYPGDVFPGRIAFIDPVLNERTRTVKVRVNVSNPYGKLKPEMFVRGVVRSQVAAGGQVVDPALAGKWMCRMHPEVVQSAAGECDICEMPVVRAETFGYVAPHPEDVPPPLVIPVSAALVTGTRAIVYVEDRAARQPTFVGREIVLGPRAGDWYLVAHGLREGEMVVTRGNFQIDSALQIQARPSMMSPEGSPAGGHDHGGMDMGDMEMPMPGEQAMVGAMPIPADVARRMRALDAAAKEVAEAMRSEEPPRIRQAFQDFGAALDEVKSDRLTGHARMVWNELAMLLGNDAFEGRRIRRMSDARRVHESLIRDIRRLREQFDLEPEHPEPEMKKRNEDRG